MRDWLERRKGRLWQRDEQIASRLDEVDGLLRDNTDTIIGLSGYLRQLIGNASRPTHAISRWQDTLSHAEEVLQLDYVKRHELGSGGSG